MEAYVPVVNCAIVSASSEKAIKEAVKKARDGRDVLKEDKRIGLYSLDNTFDKEMYLNYLDTMRTYLYRLNMPLLGLGFLPVLAPPTFIGDSWHQYTMGLLTKCNIPFRIVRSIDAHISDIWVHKFDCAELCGKPVWDVRVVDVLNALNWEVHR